MIHSFIYPPQRRHAYVAVLTLAQAAFGKQQTTSTTLKKLVSVRMEAALLHWTELILGKEDFKTKNSSRNDPPNYDVAQIRRFNELLVRVDADRKAHSDGAAERSMVALYKEQMEGQAHHAAAPVEGDLFDVDLVEESQ